MIRAWMWGYFFISVLTFDKGFFWVHVREMFMNLGKHFGR